MAMMMALGGAVRLLVCLALGGFDKDAATLAAHPQQNWPEHCMQTELALSSAC